MSKHKIVIIGKIPPPFMGTTVWFDILRKSPLNDYYQICWYNINVHSDLSTIGKIGLKKLWLNIRLYLRFFQVIKRFKPELVLIPISQSTIGFLKDSIFIIAAKNRSKTLIMLHGSNLLNWLGKSSKLMNNYFNYSVKNCTGAIVLGKSLMHVFYNWFNIRNIYVVPNGINLVRPLNKKKIGDKIVLRHISNLSTAKGIIDIIDSLNYLEGSLQKVELKVNGSFIDKKTEWLCTQKVKDSYLPVIFEGPVFGIAKHDALFNTDIFIFTPNSPEGLPFVIIEAMAFSLPIITTDQGAIKEAVFDNVNGFIVKPNSPEEIGEKLKYLVNNPDEITRMGEASLNIYNKNFTEDKMIENLRDVLNKVLC